MWIIIEVKDWKVIYKSEKKEFRHCFKKVENKKEWVLIK